MPYAKFRGHPKESGEKKKFLKVFTIYGRGDDVDLNNILFAENINT